MVNGAFNDTSWRDELRESDVVCALSTSSNRWLMFRAICLRCGRLGATPWVRMRFLEELEVSTRKLTLPVHETEAEDCVCPVPRSGT